MAEQIRVAQTIDTLDTGGAERVAVTLANGLPQDRYRSYLCTTRRDGALAATVEPHVIRWRLNRQGRFDSVAVRRLASLLREERIDLVHAHGPSLFVALAARGLRRVPRIVWHDHYGSHALQDVSAPHYKLALRAVSAVVVVNQELADWVVRRLAVPADRVFYVPNPVAVPVNVEPATGLPGQPGSRFVSVANLRPEKDHVGLLRAFAGIVRDRPEAHLLLVGKANDPQTREQVLAAIGELGLNQSVTWLGERGDIGGILAACDVAVLSSRSEGLPMALLEYGAAGLPAVVTRVGQCEDVVGGGEAGIVVEPGNPQSLEAAMTSLLAAGPAARQALGLRFRERIDRLYSVASVARRLDEIYRTVLGRQQLCGTVA